MSNKKKKKDPVDHSKRAQQLKYKKPGYQKINWDEIVALPYDTTKALKDSTSMLTTKSAHEKAQYESGEEYKALQKKKRKAERLDTESKLKKAEKQKKYDESPQSDYDRYLKKASDYYDEGYSTKVIKENIIDPTTTPPDTIPHYRNIALPKPGDFAESARQGVTAYTDSMNVAQDAMALNRTDLGKSWDKNMTTNEVRIMKNDLDRMYEEELGNINNQGYTFDENFLKQMALQKAIIPFIKEYGQLAEQYLQHKNIVY